MLVYLPACVLLCYLFLKVVILFLETDDAAGVVLLLNGALFRFRFRTTCVAVPLSEQHSMLFCILLL